MSDNRYNRANLGPLLNEEDAWVIEGCAVRGDAGLGIAASAQMSTLLNKCRLDTIVGYPSERMSRGKRMYASVDSAVMVVFWLVSEGSVGSGQRERDDSVVVTSAG